MAFAWLFVGFIQEKFLPVEVRGNLPGLDVAVFLIVCGIGSTNIFLASRQWVYHEAIAWGATLALMSYYLLLRYLSGSGRSMLLRVPVPQNLAPVGGLRGKLAGWILSPPASRRLRPRTVDEIAMRVLLCDRPVASAWWLRHRLWPAARRRARRYFHWAAPPAW